jgi:hypothetical protein
VATTLFTTHTTTMSLAVLTQAYDEMRRLAIAGSGVAPGDFRLKKLIVPLAAAGEKAPVFAKVAQAAQAVVDSNEKTASAALLEMATLVNAILYTQGETGVAGEFAPLETTDLGGGRTQASARLLKPLLEALSTTGSGRLELIRDAFDRGAFADLRLVKPALQALDDPYPEIADFIADKVLPLYGKAIFDELRRQYLPKGRGGHVRRLSLMHQLDPQGTRDLVKQTLDDGSKELKVVAIECLGESDEDLAFLLEQSKAKAKDVRAAALGALTKLRAADALDRVQKSLAGADLELLVERVRASDNPELLSFVLAEANAQFDGLLKLRDKPQQGPAIARMLHLLRCLDGREDAGTEALLLKVYEKGNVLAVIKSEPSGSDINETVAYLMSHASKAARERLIANHETLSGPMLTHAFVAARRTLSPAQLFEMFSPSLLAKPDKKAKKNAGAFGRLEAIRNGLFGHHVYDWRYSGPVAFRMRRLESLPEFDPRWLDAAVEAEQLDLVAQFARPGHAATNKYLSEQYAKARNKNDSDAVLETMVRVQHPQATPAVLELLEEGAKARHPQYEAYRISRWIPQLPPEAAPQIEALLPKLPDNMVDLLMDPVLQLKNKSSAATG